MDKNSTDNDQLTAHVNDHNAVIADNNNNNNNNNNHDEDNYTNEEKDDQKNYDWETSDEVMHPCWSGRVIPVRIDTAIKNLSSIDSVNQTFRCKLHVYVYRGLSPMEEKQFNSLDNKNDFVPQLNLFFEPQFSADVLRFERVLWNNGKEYIFGYNFAMDMVSVGYFFIVDCVFLEDFELKNFPFDVQHFEVQFEIQAELQNDSIDLYPFEINLRSSTVGIVPSAAEIVGWKFVGLECGVEQQNWQNTKHIGMHLDKVLKFVQWKGGMKRLFDRYNYFNNIKTEANNNNNDNNNNDNNDGSSIKKKKENLSLMYSGQYSKYYFRMKFQRQWRFFFTRVVIVLGILSFLSLFCFTFGEDTIPDRFGFVSTMLLAGVAYMFIIVSFIPALNYLTLLDKYVYFTFVFLLLIGIENGIFSILSEFFDVITDYTLTFDAGFFGSDLLIWSLAHWYFYKQSIKGMEEEAAKIDATKEMIDSPSREAEEKERKLKEEKEGMTRGDCYFIGGAYDGVITSKHWKEVDFLKDDTFRNKVTIINNQPAKID